nr:hypothetical protein [Tanacetum cinerariifolium]
MNYLEEQTNGEAMINSIKNGDQPLPRVTQVSIAKITSTEQTPLKDKSMWSNKGKRVQKIDRLARSLLIQGLPNDIYSLIDNNKTAKDLWDALARHMLGSEYGEQDRKAVKCWYSKDNCKLNFKFLNNLQPEWKQYATMMRQNKNLMDINIDALYNILKQNQGDVNDAMGSKKKTIVVTSDPLALIAEKTNVSRSKEKVVVSSDSEGSEADDFSANRASWKNKLNDALLAFHTAYKTPIRCTPYKLVYRKAYHLPVELEHKAYSALKHGNFDLKTVGDHMKTDGEAMINSIKNDDQPLPRVTQVSIAGTTSTEQPPLKDKSMWSDQEKRVQKIDLLARSLLIQGLLNDVYSLIDSNKTAKDLWDALARHMLGLEFGEQDRKAAVLCEYETFKATEGELLLDTYIRYLQVINDLKKCGYSKDNYVNDAIGSKKKTVVVTFDPLPLIVEKTNVSRSKEKVVVSFDSEGSKADDFRETRSEFMCNDAMNVSCDSRMNDLLDDNNFFIFDDVNVRISPVSKMHFRKKPRDSMNVHSKSNSNKSLPRTVHKWLPKLEPLAKPIAKWFPRVKRCSKHMTGNHALLTNFMEKFLGTVRFGNNDFAVIAGYGDVVIDGVDLLTGYRSSNLYTIALNKVTSNSSTCLLAKASSSQSWLWHQCLSHLNFATINNLVKNNLVQGLPKMKFEKYHLCSVCEQGKIHWKHHKSKTAFSSIRPLYLLHIDLCGPMHVQSINGKRYVLVVVDDYSWYTLRVRTDNGTEFKNKTLAKFFDEIACFTQNRSIIHKRFDKTPYELINKRKPNIKFFRVFGCRCYLLNDYEDVGKLKAKVDIRVFVGYSKESTAFRIYNKRTRKIHESVNVNFDEILKMASKQFSLEPGLSNLNETGKSLNRSVSKVDEASKNDLDYLFQDFYDEYFDSSKIMKSSTTNVETPIIEEVFHEVSESFQGESSSSSLNDDVQQSSEEVILPSSNTQSILVNMVPNGDEASTSHNVFNERLKDAYFDASTLFHDPSNVQTYYQPYPHEKKWTKDHPLHKIIGDPKSSVRTRGQLANSCLFSCLLSSIEPANMAEALRDADWVNEIQEELDQFARLKESDEFINSSVENLIPNPTLNDNPTLSSDFMTKSSSTSLNSLLEETNIFDNSLPEFETFCFDLEEISTGSTTTRSDISLPEYEAFYVNHVKEISSGRDLAKITKKQSKPVKIEHEIEKIAQKPDPNTVLCTKAQITNQDKEKHSIQYKEYLENSYNAITPVLPTEEPEYSLSMGYEHLSTISKTKLDEVIMSSAKNLVPIPSEYEVTFDDESECDVPVKDESSPIFTTFSNHIFDDNNDFTSSDHESLSSEEEVPMEDFKVYSNPLFDDDEIKSDKLDPYCFNAKFDLIESLSNHDTLIESSLKFNYLEEFSGALMPTSIIDEKRIKREHEEYISLMEKEEIDIFTGMDDLLPSKPPDVVIFLEPNSGEVISAVMNNIDELVEMNVLIQEDLPHND